VNPAWKKPRPFRINLGHAAEMHESRNREISLDRRIREQLVAELFNRPGLLHREIHEPPERRKINQRMIKIELKTAAGFCPAMLQQGLND
jgi:hypothetical protein